MALHKLFDDGGEDVEEYVDLRVEPFVQLGGVAEGIAPAIVARSSLAAYSRRMGT
jgi:DNA-binding ferritin-like protein